MKFKPGQKLIVQEDGSFAFADEDDVNSKDSDAGLQKRNEETSKVLRSLSEDQDSSSSPSSSDVNEKEVQSPPPAISPPPPSPSPPPPNAPVAQPVAVQPAAIDPTQTAQMLYQQNIAAMNNQMMMNAAASNNNNANANANMGSNFKLTSENLDAVAMAKLEHDTANRNALELYDISNQNRDAAELARSEHETAMHWRQEAQKNLERLEATAAKKAISEENAAQQQEKLQNLNALVSEFKKALVEETALRRKADIEKENLAREYEQKKIEIATKASEAQGRLIEHAKDKILEARRTAALATQQANEYLEQAKREAITRRRIGEFAKRSNSKMNEDKKTLAKRLQAEKDEISEAAKEVQRSAEEALMRLNSANSQAQKERDLALSDRQQALEEAKRAVDTAKMSLDGMKEMSRKAQKYKRRQEETVDSVKEYIKNDGEGKFDKLDKLLRKAEDEDLSSSHPGGKKSKSSSSSTKKKKRKNSDKGIKDIDGMSDEDAAAEKVKKLLGGGGEGADADASADSDDAVAEGSGKEDDAILEPMTDDVDSILANAEKNGALAESTSAVSTAEDVRSSVENSGAITEAEAEKNLAAYFGETTPSPTPVSSASDDSGKEEESNDKKSDDATEEKTSTEENVEAAPDKGEKEEEEKKRDEANTETRQNAAADDDDNASDPSSLITLDDQEVSNIPTSGVVASLGFPSITRIAFGEPEQKAFKGVFFAYLREQAPDSCASADDMETYVQERTKKTGTKAEHLRVTLVCSSASSEADTLKAQQVVRDGVSDGSLLKKLAASGIKSRVFIDEYEDKKEVKDEGEDVDDTTTTEEDEKERGVKQEENDEQQ